MIAHQDHIQILPDKLTVFVVVKEATKTIKVAHIVVYVAVDHTPIQKDKRSALNARTV